MTSSLKINLLLSIFLISACGGGGGGSSSDSNGGSGSSTNLPVIDSFSADQTSIIVGNSITLSWSTSYATTCIASGSWGGAKATSGSETFLMSNRGTFEYFLVCSNSRGSSSQKSVTIEVTANTSGGGDPYDEDKPSYCRATENSFGKVIYSNLDNALNDDSSYVHIYGKEETRPNRKMGHITIICDNFEDAYRKAKNFKNTIKVKSINNG